MALVDTLFIYMLGALCHYGEKCRNTGDPYWRLQGKSQWDGNTLSTAVGKVEMNLPGNYFHMESSCSSNNWEEVRVRGLLRTILKEHMECLIKWPLSLPNQQLERSTSFGIDGQFFPAAPLLLDQEKGLDQSNQQLWDVKPPTGLE